MFAPPTLFAQLQDSSEVAVAEYSQSAIFHWSGVQIGASIRKISVSNQGEVAVLANWNFGLETWETEFDAEKHVAPLKRISDDPQHHDYKCQAFAVPFKPFADPAAFVTYYTLEDGQPKEVWCAEDRNATGVRANLGW